MYPFCWLQWKQTVKECLPERSKQNSHQPVQLQRILAQFTKVWKTCDCRQIIHMNENPLTRMCNNVLVADPFYLQEAKHRKYMRALQQILGKIIPT